MLNFIIINSGEARAQDIAWQIEDQQATVTQQQNTFSLNAGEEMNVNALIRYTSSGNYNPLIKIDPSNSIKELDESNNQAGLQLTIS